MRLFTSYALSALVVLVTMNGAWTEAQDASPDQPSLAESQERLAETYDRLELLAGRLAELSRSTQPRRAKLLRELVAKSRERDLPGRFDAVVLALKNNNLATAEEGQTELQRELQQLLDLLLQEDRERQIEAERKRIAKFLADLKRLIRLERGIKARTEGGDESIKLSEDQRQTAQATGKLASEIKKTERSEKTPSSQQGSSTDKQSSPGEPSDGKNSAEEQPSGKESQDKQSPGDAKDGKPAQQGQQGQPGQQSSGGPSGGDQAEDSQPQKPVDKATERLQRAQQRMQQALERLQEANREDAAKAQEEALRELEQAKAELERILRQLREEEMERMLVLLEARFRKMLDAQIAVYEQTKSLDATQAQTKEHELEIASGRLSRKEQRIVRDADQALTLLWEDGTSVAFPEAIEQAREDMQAVAERLAKVKLGSITQTLEEDVIAALEEMLSALQQALKELREQKARQQPGSGQPGEQALVDQLAELRMIRALQMRINRRTKLYGELIDGEQVLERELLEALDHLAEREERVFRATLDLHQGANK